MLPGDGFNYIWCFGTIQHLFSLYFARKKPGHFSEIAQKRPDFVDFC